MASHEYPHLFSPFRINAVELPNRLVMLPHVTFYGTHQRTPSKRHHYYYLERARGGVGLIITESQYVHETSAVENCVDASNREGMMLWRKTVDAVHSYGTRMFAQITHHGIQAFGADTYLPSLSASPIPDATVREIPKQMDSADMQMIIDAFRVSAANVKAAGFDGVELKVGHDGMLRAFLSPYFNRRQDAYGGSRENRLRFVLEVLRAVRAEVGTDYALGIRFCMNEFIPGGYDLEDAQWYARTLSEAGVLDYISTDMGTWMTVDMQVPPMTVPQGFALDAIRCIKDVVDMPIIAFGRIKTPEHAEKILASGDADLIGMARQLLCDSEFANKARTGNAAQIRPCVACNQECVGRLVRNQPIGCVHNPAAGHEEILGVDTLVSASQPKRVAVIGGGPAGLKAAEVAAQRGHLVTLYEKSDRLGGQVVYAAQAPDHAEWGEIVSHLEARIRHLGVTIRLETAVTVETLMADKPDVVVVATGASAGLPPFAVKGELPVLNEWQVIEGDAPHNQRVLLLDMGVRFEGAALAEILTERGNQVTWMAATPTLAFEVDPATLMPLRRRLAEKNTQIIPETTVLEVYDDTVLTLNVFTTRVQPLGPFDAIVIAGNKTPNNALTEAIRQHFELVFSIGDSVTPRHVAIAIREGENVGRIL